MYRLVFIDIDGTLLTSQHKISRGTETSIRRITAEKKVMVVLTTARPPQAVEELYGSLNLSDPVTCFNGALVLENLNQRNYSNVLKSSNINPGLLEILGNSLVSSNMNISFYKSGEWFASNRDSWIKQEEEIIGRQATIADMGLIIEEWINQKEGPHKVLLMGEPPAIDSVELTLKTRIGDRLNIYKSKPTYLEIIDNHASKTTAIKFLMNKYAIEREEVMAMGDNYNDIEMLQFAGLGIAMGNAPADVKVCADYVTLDNDSEGIQNVLDRFIQ